MIGQLPEGPLDIVGDVHGELDALRAVLAAAGYDPSGRHPEGRHLVFLGDLVDRGPDSPGVVRWVRALVEAGRASALLGNHELNLLRGKRKPGNDWFWGEHAHHDQKYAPYAFAGAGRGEELLAFFRKMPLALERADLRLVHAAWDAPSVARLAALGDAADLETSFAALDRQAEATMSEDGLLDRARAERAAWRHHFSDAAIDMPMLPNVGRLDQTRQMLNPFRVLTSGTERCADAPFFAGGQWRFAQRVAWWETYDDTVPVVVGHYWRQYQALDRHRLGKGDADLFEGWHPTAWLGPRGMVFCADFSVGGRYQERAASTDAYRTRLAALRWPERTLVLDTGETVPTSGFGIGSAR